MDGKSKATGEVYRGEAAELMAAAARQGQTPKSGPIPFPRQPAAPPVELEPRRPLPYPEPVGINDNVEDPPPARRPAKRFSFVRFLAWLVISPLYLLVAAVSLGVLFLFAKSFFGF